MISIDEFMTPNPFTLKKSDPIEAAWKIMTEKRIRHIPIVDNDDQVLGLVTQTDVLAASKPISSSKSIENKVSSNTDITISDIMIDDVAVIHPSENLRQAGLYMQSHKHGCLPVVSKKRLVGIITDSDFITIAVNLLEQSDLQDEQYDDGYLLDDDL